jgi:large subunit ribosomal protein L11
MKTKNLKLYIRAQGAETGPPLGTVLGNLGLNTVKFCKEFNDLTKEIPPYLKLAVSIVFDENNGYSLILGEPSTGFILSLLKKEETCLKKDGSSFISLYISMEDLLKLARFKFPDFNLEISVPIILGGLRAANIGVKC